jgi:hypothetical protein
VTISTGSPPIQADYSRTPYAASCSIASWVEHLRQNERVTNDHQILGQQVHLLVTKPPTVTHLIASTGGE